MLREFEEVHPFDLVLFAMPLGRFRPADPTAQSLARIPSA
jgi:hypothetical protein